MSNYPAFPKIPRLEKEIVITEKIDGTNAQIAITFDQNELAGVAPCAVVLTEVGACYIYAGSRSRWLTTEADNFGFARWVADHAVELVKLGHGHHYGEWWGSGIQRGYGLTERRFSLFNTGRWAVHQLDSIKSGDYRCMQVPICHVVPELARGAFDQHLIDRTLLALLKHGSFAALGFEKPEGAVVFHSAANQLFKIFCAGE